MLGTVGADPIRADADPERAWRAVHRSTRAVAVLLMDQSITAGVGNIYRAEVLFRAHLDPMTPGNRLTRATWDRIWADLVVLMRRGVADGRIDTVAPGAHPRGHGTAPESRPARRRGLRLPASGTALPGVRRPRSPRRAWAGATCSGAPGASGGTDDRGPLGPLPSSASPPTPTAGRWPPPTSTAAGMVMIDAPSPWRAVGVESSGREIEVTAEHPDGARMRIRHTVEETWDMGLTVRASGPADQGAGTAMEIPHRHPRPRLAGRGRRGHQALRNGRLLEWKQLSGDSRMGDDDDSDAPLGGTVALDAGDSVSCAWRGHEVTSPRQLLRDLPGWLPAELIESDGTEIWCDTPDAGLMLDGAETDGQVLLGRAGLHELEVRQARGTTRPTVGWAPSFATVRRIRGEEIMGSLDVRRADGARLWILTRAAEAADVNRAALEMVDEALENLLSRPGADLFTVLTALTPVLGHRRHGHLSAALQALSGLAADRPASMAHALAVSLGRISGGPEPGPLEPPRQIGDPLVRAEWSMSLTPGPDPITTAWRRCGC